MSDDFDARVRASQGVPAPELHCPTCGVKFADLTAQVHREPKNLPQTAFATRDMIEPRRGDMLYLTCPSGHAWSIKKITRWPIEDPHPDLVLLGDFLPDLSRTRPW